MEDISGPEAGRNATGILDDLDSRLGSHPALFGEKLLVLGRLTTPIGGPGLVALDASGAAVLVTALAPPTRSGASRLAEEVDRLSDSSMLDLKRQVGMQAGDGSLQERHRSWFEGSQPVFINHAQRLIVVVPTEPTPKLWDLLQNELGSHLSDVYVYGPQSLQHVRPPAVESPARSAGPAAPRERRPRAGPQNLIGGLALSSLLGIGALILGAGLIIVGVSATLRSSVDPDDPTETFVQVPIRTVASGVSSTATFTQWVGQQRIVRISDDRLLVLFMGDRGLEIVADERNQGRTWRSAVGVPGVSGESFSVAADGRDRLHLVLGEEGAISYVRLTRTPSGWESGEVLELSDSATQVANIAWESSTGTAQVVWTEETPDGELPMWAAVGTEEASPSVLAEEQLTEAGTESDALVNVASFDDGRVIAAYRSGVDSGWYSRIAAVDDLGALAWEPEERLPTKDFAGALSLAIDDGGTVHLALRDDTNSRITYFRRIDPGGWSGGETAVKATSSEEIELPSIAVDTASRLVYIFFVDTSEAMGDLQVAIRDPATRWEGPDGVAGDGEVDEGSLYPATMARSDGQPILIWTTQGEVPAIQSARISAP